MLCFLELSPTFSRTKCFLAIFELSLQAKTDRGNIKLTANSVNSMLNEFWNRKSVGFSLENLKILITSHPPAQRHYSSVSVSHTPAKHCTLPRKHIRQVSHMYVFASPHSVSRFGFSFWSTSNGLRNQDNNKGKPLLLSTRARAHTRQDWPVRQVSRPGQSRQACWPRTQKLVFTTRQLFKPKPTADDIGNFSPTIVGQSPKTAVSSFEWLSAPV